MRLAAFDVESAGKQPSFALQPFRARDGSAWLTSIAYALTPKDPTRPVAIFSELKPTADKIRPFLVYCSQNNITICGWNTAFDIAWLIALGLRDEVMACKWLDGILLWKQTRMRPTFETTKESMGYGLKPAVAHFLPQYAGYEKGVNFDAESEAGLQELREYNEHDTDFTLQIVKILWGMLDARQKRVALIEAACIPMIADTFVRGVEADRDIAVALAQELEDDANTAYMKLKLSDPEITKTIMQSPKQLGDHLVTKWGIKPVKVTGAGKISTDRESLAQMALQDPRASLLNDYRENNSNRTKFAEAVVESLDYNGDGCTRPAHRIYGTYTARMTISSTTGKNKDEVQTGIALHQWKRDARFRKQIRAPKGYTLCEFDFAGQEYRWMAVLSGDQTMRQLCQPGEDAHSFMAARIIGYDYQQFLADLKGDPKVFKPKRQLGKVANLSLQYRTSAKKLVTVAAVQHNILITEDEGKVIHKTYQKTYPNVPMYWKQQKFIVQTQNYIENLAGRRVYFNDLGARDRMLSWSYDSTGVNYPIQSMGAEQKYLAMMQLRALLPAYGGLFYFELHDGLFVLLPDDQVEAGVPAIQHALSNLPYKKAFGIDLPIKFPVDCKVGPSWGELVEWPV